MADSAVSNVNVSNADVGGMHVTGTALHDAWWAKTAPPVEQIADGVWSIPVPAADLPIRYTLSYLFQGTDGAALVVDPGWDSDAGWDALLAGWASATPGDVTGILITHGHPLSRRKRAAEIPTARLTG